jgi:hypothetical protein
MAVVQISKIQLRRGKKLETGMPQLASGEMAWAVDTQELYIGNGAVSEGAPAVGNTKILTENDTLLDLLEQYRYKPTDATILTGLDGNVTLRTLQSRLDEGSVNAASFGISGIDEDVDQTALIQNAIYSLFMSTSVENRVNLEFDPGVYRLTGTVYVPSNVRLIGSGKDSTIFNFVKGGINYRTTLSLAGTSVATAGNYTNITTTRVGHTGDHARVTVSKTGTGTSYSNVNTTITIVFSGSGYSVGDVIVVPGAALGGSTPANNLTITLSSTATNPVFNTSTIIEFINETSTTTQRNVSPTDPNNQPKNILLKEFTIDTNSNSVRPFNFTNVRDSEFYNVKVIGNWVSGDGDIALSRALEMTATGSSTTTCQRNKFVGFHAEGFSYGVFSNTDIIYNTFTDCVFRTLNRGVGFGVDAGISANGPRKNTIENSLFDTINEYAIIVDKGTGNRSRGNTFVNVGNDGGALTNNVYSHIKFTTPGNSSTNDNFDRAASLASSNYASAYITEIEGYAHRSETAPTKISLNSTVPPLQAFRLPLNTSSSFEVSYVFQSATYAQMRKGTLNIAVDKNNTNVQLVDDYEYTGTPGQDGRIIFTASIITVSGVKTVGIYYTNANTSDTNSFTYTVTSLGNV